MEARVARRLAGLTRLELTISPGSERRLGVVSTQADDLRRRASRFADRAVFLAASRAPVFIMTVAPVHPTERARFDRATFHAGSPAAFNANALRCIVQFYSSRKDAPACAETA